jgi:hypothetical protein
MRVADIYNYIIMLTTPLLCLLYIITSASHGHSTFKGGPRGILYRVRSSYFYNHAHRLRLEKLLMYTVYCI